MRDISNDSNFTTGEGSVNMEQPHDLGFQYSSTAWMSMKRKHGSVWRSTEQFHQLAADTVGDTWEEALAEDAAGPLGGCIWPPRSYSCSFCQREFRSAQALGGHMNVHRRDRARLHRAHNNNIPQTSCAEEPEVSQINDHDQKHQIPHTSPSILQPYPQRCPLSDSGMPFWASYLKSHDDHVDKSDLFSNDRIPLPVPRVLLIKPCPKNDDMVSGGSMEELDLELRLGDPPKVK